MHLLYQHVAGEDSSRCHAESVVAVLAAPLVARGDEVVLMHHAACWAGHGFAITPTYLLEDLECLFVVHFKHTAYLEGAGFC